MAKATSSKGSKPASIHSRAARRATSPSIDTDKSIKALVQASNSQPFLSVQNEAGVKKRKGKQTSRHKRQRHEKGLQRAESVLDQLEKKVEKASKREKSIKERSHDWDNVNDKLGKKRYKSDMSKDRDSENTEGEMEDVKVDNVVSTALVGEETARALGGVATEEDEVL